MELVVKINLGGDSMAERTAVTLPLQEVDAMIAEIETRARPAGENGC